MGLFSKLFNKTSISIIGEERYLNHEQVISLSKRLSKMNYLIVYCNEIISYSGNDTDKYKDVFNSCGYTGTEFIVNVKDLKESGYLESDPFYMQQKASDELFTAKIRISFVDDKTVVLTLLNIANDYTDGDYVFGIAALNNISTIDFITSSSSTNEFNVATNIVDDNGVVKCNIIDNYKYLAVAMNPKIFKQSVQSIIGSSNKMMIISTKYLKKRGFMTSEAFYCNLNRKTNRVTVLSKGSEITVKKITYTPKRFFAVYGIK